MKNGFFLLAVFVCVVVGLSVRAGAGVVELRASARAAPGAPVTLADIATLEGPEAQALAGVVVLETPGADAAARPWIEIDLATVRAALERAGVNWGRVALRGNSCSLRIGSGEREPEPEREPQAYQRREPERVDLSGPPTIRARIARTLARFYGVSPDDLQLLFDERDDDLLAQLERGRRIELQPEASPSSGRVPVTVRIYQGMRIVEERTVRIDARVRQDVLMLTSDIRRGDEFTAEHVRTESRWLSPGPMYATDIDAVVGSRARTRMQAGTSLRLDHVESPVVVRRNELVTVRCLSGSVVLTGKARALSDARVGDLIEMRLLGARESFLARVDGPGRAVSDTNHQQRENKEREQ
ncbi:MAG: flagella basal body P-ring formation protein FlgA [Phycisphaeraceae bacterium]|nr:MAG: flagella basal body P-ring formation protein FlgA [Phycisphaeraceae bacterium]